MAQPITIKKKKLTVKSKAAQTVATAPSAEATEAPTAEATPMEAAAPVEAAPVAATPAKQPSYTFFAILAIITLLMFIGIAAIQWTEWSYLQPAFPHPIQTGPMTAPIP